MQLGAVIAAAGLSSRMGAFKPLLPLGDSTIIERIINTLREGGVEEIVVVTGRDAFRLETVLAAYHLYFIHNGDYARTDMFYSASLGLRFMTTKADAVFFTPADSPLFTVHTVRLLAAELGTSDIIIPVFQGKEGHPVTMRSPAALEIINHKSTATPFASQGLRGAIDTYCGPKTFLDVDDPGIVRDMDTPEDYRLLTADYSTTALRL